MGHSIRHKWVNTGLFDFFFQIANPSMRGVLLVYMLVLCLLTLDNSMMARAGKLLYLKPIKNTFVEFKRCCVKKGCPFSVEIHRLNCKGFLLGNKVACMCK